MKTDSTLKFKKQLDKIISHYSAISDSEYIVTDFHIIVNPSTGSFQILNDDEFVLASETIDEWAIEKDNSKTAESIQNDIKNQLEELNNQDFFNSLNIYKPFSFLFENVFSNILQTYECCEFQRQCLQKEIYFLYCQQRHLVETYNHKLQ